MSADPAAEGDQPSGSSNEIDELLETLVYRHESPDGTEGEAASSVALDATPVVQEPSRRRRGFPVLLVAGLLAAAVAVALVFAGILSDRGETSSDEAQDRSSTSIAGAAADEESTETTELEVGQDDTEASEPTSPTTAQPVSRLRLGIVVPGRADDRAFSQSMVDGATTMASTGDAAETTVVDNVDPGSAGEELRRLAEEGYDLVVAHSSAFEDAVFEIAPEYPEVTFAVAGLTDPVPLNNVYTYTVAAEEGGYLLGALGALLSTNRTIGVVGPAEIGVSKRYVDGFHQGAHDERADLAVLIGYAGSFSDAEAFVQVAERHLDREADVLTGHGNELDAAIGVASDRGAIWLGSQANQTPVSPESVVASQVYRWDVVLLPIMAEIEADEIEGRHLRASLSNGGIVIEYNELRMPSPEILDRVDQLTADIIAGSLQPLDGRSGG